MRLPVFIHGWVTGLLLAAMIRSDSPLVALVWGLPAGFMFVQGVRAMLTAARKPLAVEGGLDTL
jgi:hypothetical protein